MNARGHIVVEYIPRRYLSRRFLGSGNLSTSANETVRVEKRSVRDSQILICERPALMGTLAVSPRAN